MLLNLLKAIRLSLILWLLTGIIYPLLILGVGQLPALREKATGSIVYNLQNQPYGSSLIGQAFTSERYFRGRPSAIRYSQGKQGRPTGVSGATNLAPSNPDLVKRIIERGNALREENLEIYPDLIYTSASGLDPHISIQAARTQLDQVARARGIQPEEITQMVRQSIEGKFLGIFGESGVNVLKLNYTLDLNEFNRQQNK